MVPKTQYRSSVSYNILIFFSLVFSSAGWAQPFQPAGLPGMSGGAFQLYTDTTTNTMWYAGLVYDSTFSLNRTFLYSYRNGSWTEEALVDGTIRDIVSYNNNLYIAGSLRSVDSVPVSNIARFDGTNWYSFGDFNRVIYRLRVVNDTLYSLGGFSVVDGDSISLIAKYNGANWQALNFPHLESNRIEDIVVYNGKLYVSGNFHGQTIEDVAVYNNGIWERVGQGIQGGLTIVGDAEVYKGELYIGGEIYASAGNPSNGILKWDGFTWQDVGGGLNRLDGNGVGFLFDMRVHEGYLYAVGNFATAGGVPGLGLARWDGTEWCAAGLANDTLDQSYYAIGFYQDTMYLSCNDDTVAGQYVNKLMKVTDPDFFFDSCGVVISSVVEEVPSTGSSIRVYPNPVQTNLHVEAKERDRSIDQVQVVDASGRLVLSYSSAGTRITLDVSSLPRGIYFVRISHGNEAMVQKINKL